MGTPDFQTVDEYIAAQPEETRDVLTQVRKAIRKAVPKAQESISYKMPTYKLGGNILLYFAAWKRHYSLYPASAQMLAAFGEELSSYAVHKATIRLPYAEPVPVPLIVRIAKFRAEELAPRR